MIHVRVYIHTPIPAGNLHYDNLKQTHKYNWNYKIQSTPLSQDSCTLPTINLHHNKYEPNSITKHSDYPDHMILVYMCTYTLQYQQSILTMTTWDKYKYN